LTTIAIIKQARITRVDRQNRKITASGVDTITGSARNRVFEYVTEPMMEKAEQFLQERTPLIIDIDSSTKNISLRVEQGK
jgi:hypothetical protein